MRRGATAVPLFAPAALVLTLLFAVVPAHSAALSPATEECLGCHEEVTPGIVADWKASRHSRVTLAEALQKPRLERRVLAAAAPEAMADRVVGCAERHLMRAERHPHSFEHNGHRVHTIRGSRCALWEQRL